MTTEWRDIAGFEDCYAINRNGQVLSLDRIVNTSGGRGQTTRHVPARLLYPSRGVGGQLPVNLFRHGRACHRLISHRAMKMDSQDKQVKFVRTLIDAYPTAECRTNGNSDYLLKPHMSSLSRPRSAARGRALPPASRIAGR